MVRGRGNFETNFFFLQKAKVLSAMRLNTWKYNVCSIKLETKVLHLDRIWVYSPIAIIRNVKIWNINLLLSFFFQK